MHRPRDGKHFKFRYPHGRSGSYNKRFVKFTTIRRALKESRRRRERMFRRKNPNYIEIGNTSVFFGKSQIFHEIAVVEPRLDNRPGSPLPGIYSATYSKPGCPQERYFSRLFHEKLSRNQFSFYSYLGPNDLRSEEDRIKALLTKLIRRKKLKDKKRSLRGFFT